MRNNYRGSITLHLYRRVEIRHLISTNLDRESARIIVFFFNLHIIVSRLEIFKKEETIIQIISGITTQYGSILQKRNHSAIDREIRIARIIYKIICRQLCRAILITYTTCDITGRDAIFSKIIHKSFIEMPRLHPAIVVI